MRTTLRSRLIPMLLLAPVLIAGAQTAGTTAGMNNPRMEKLGKRLVCACGCDELLGECNHMGCPDSPKMLAKLSAAVTRGDDDNTIFHAFQDEYGATALAAPMFTGFNRFSWFVPPLMLLIGIAGVFLLVRRWRPQVAAMPPRSTDPRTNALQQRVRREIEGDLL